MHAWCSENQSVLILHSWFLEIHRLFIMNAGSLKSIDVCPFLMLGVQKYIFLFIMEQRFKDFKWMLFKKDVQNFLFMFRMHMITAE